MPWEHCATSIADHAPCPTCGKSKTEWTLRWDVTRTFRLSKSKGAGAPELRSSLLDWKGDPAAGEPFVAHAMQSKFNVSWRTATFRYFLAMSPVWNG